VCVFLSVLCDFSVSAAYIWQKLQIIIIIIIIYYYYYCLSLVSHRTPQGTAESLRLNTNVVLK